MKVITELKSFSLFLEYFKPRQKYTKTLTITLSTWFFISGILYLKIPAAFSKIYAEDGSLSLQDALSNPFPMDYFQSYAGYFDIVARTAGRVVTLFPLQNAAQVFFIFNTFILTVITLTCFRASSEMIPGRFGRGVLSLSLVFIPIASFESIANSTNLHFLIMSACLPIFLAKNPSTSNSLPLAFFVLLAALSTPLMIFYLPLIILLKIRTPNSKTTLTLNRIQIAWFIGVLFQLIFVLTQTLGQRSINELQSFEKIGYLYLDRVFGSTFFPWWGNISNSTSSIAPEFFSAQTYLLLRGAFALVFLLTFLFYTHKLTKNNSHARYVINAVLLTGVIYWVSIGVLFSPEPRYAIFPSFGFLLVLFYAQSQKPHLDRNGYLERVLVLVILLTWIGSWSPSDLRISGPSWQIEYLEAKDKCMKNAKVVEIPVSPTNQPWMVKLSCKKILGN